MMCFSFLFRRSKTKQHQTVGRNEGTLFYTVVDGQFIVIGNCRMSDLYGKTKLWSSLAIWLTRVSYNGLEDDHEKTK